MIEQMSLDFETLYEDDDVKVGIHRGQKYIRVKFASGEAKIDLHESHIEVMVSGNGGGATIQPSAGNVFHIGLLPPMG